MTGPHPAVAATRLAARTALEQNDRRVLVAVSGGADSLALAAAVAFECDPARPAGLPVRVGAVVVDHGLQTGSDRVAERAAQVCAGLGLETEVVQIAVAEHGDGGPEARARTARYSALEAVARRVGADAVLLGHTRDDQAEQVVLGLARGSGARSLSGIPPHRGLFRRPLLDLPRTTMRAACEALGLDVWDDPHNEDPRFLRVRVRRLLAAAETEVPGIGAALARTAGLLRDDADALDAIADERARGMGESPWDVEAVAGHPSALRRRVWRRLLLDAGVPGGALTSTHLAGVDDLVGRWHGQGAVHLPGGWRAHRIPNPPRVVVDREAGPSERPGRAASYPPVG